jgi:uncharacterized tellurite resistance protein B-like protein
MPQMWYCLIDGQQLGPMGSGELRALAAKQKLLPSHFVRQNPAQDWVPAARVKGLFSKAAPLTGSTVRTAPRAGRRWMVRIDDRELGPYSDDDIRRYAASNTFRAEHELRANDGPTWFKASEVRDLLAGNSDTAPEKASSFADPSILRFSCPSCSRRWRFRAEHVGKTFECPACRARIMVPKPAPSTPNRNDTIDTRRPTPLPPADKVGEKVAALWNFGASSIKKAAEWLQRPPFVAETNPDATGNIASPGRNGFPSQRDYRPPRDGIRFYGFGGTVDLGCGPLRDPFVYATGGRLGQVQEASLIELPLAVQYESRDLSRLPYWPTYHDCNPAQRGRYLKWLYGGRSDATIDLGYVFIFFYGLEHRVVVDDVDHQAVIEEILRLLKIYSTSRSFYGYATSLLWLTIYLAGDRLGSDDSVVHRAFGQMTRWTDDTLRFCLAYFHRRGKPLPSEVAFAVADHDERSPNSVIAKRHPERLRALFATRYRQQFPDGFQPQPSRTITIDYRPASPTLTGSRHSTSMLLLRSVPDVLSLQAAIKMLVDIWNTCIAELREFDRASRHQTQPASTAAAYEALPAELRTEEHPELGAWQAVINETTDEGGWPVTPISKLASIKGITIRKKLTKRHAESLLITADAIGFCVEPDIRLTGKTYDWDQAVVVFRQTGAPPTEVEVKSFHSASTLLQLGLEIAEADGQVDQAELKHIAAHLEEHFDLGERMTKRLDALTHLVAVHGADATGVTPGALKAVLTLPQRQLVGEYLVGVAAADRVITADERRTLKRLFRSLEVPEEVLADLIARYEEYYAAAEDPGGAAAEAVIANVPVELDLELIRKMRAETVQLQELLNEVLNPDTAELIDDAVVNPEEGSHVQQVNTDGLPADTGLVVVEAIQGVHTNEQIASRSLSPSQAPVHYRKFFDVLISRPRWSRVELAARAREHGVMLNAAIEVLNEWIVEATDELLIEEQGEEWIVHRECLRSS